MVVEDTEITRFYKDKVVFVTGGTGFIGKVLIEKLLRCTDVAKIYLLVRTKKGKTPRERIKQIFEARLFDAVKEERPDCVQSVDVVDGDLDAPNLGLSSEHWNMLTKQVNIVLHCAATVRFDEDLSKALRMNVGAVGAIVDLCKEVNHLEALVHVSTAYSYCYQSHLDEKVRTSSSSPREIFSLVSSLKEEVLNSSDFTNKLIGEYPNTYNYTKGLAEELVSQECQGLPVAIIRPSIVISSWQEPMPGWVDNINGPTGLFLIAGIGVMRTALVHRELQVDGVPVDTCSNIILAAACHTAKQFSESPSEEVKIYNHVSTNKAPINWGQAYDYTYEALFKFPLEGMVWYPGGEFRKSKMMNSILEFLLHTVPANVADTVMVLTGRNRFAVRLCEKMHKGMRVLEFFTTNQWSWTSHNTENLAELMEPRDREIYRFSLEGIDWKQFMENQVKGTRHYLMKQCPSTLPACRRKLKVLYCLDCLAKLLLVALLYSLLYYIFDMAKLFG